MSKRMLIVFSGLAWAAISWGCGGGGKTESGNTGTPPAENAAPAPGIETPSETPEMAAAPTDTTPMPPERAYKTVHDPNATYGAADLPTQGSYLKIDFTDLTSDQLDRVIHRVRTEFCTCGCTNDTIDQCLVNDPACGTAVTLAKQVIREEKLKG